MEGVSFIQIEQNNKTVQYNKNKYKKQPENVGGLRATKTFINDKLMINYMYPLSLLHAPKIEFYLEIQVKKCLYGFTNYLNRSY